MKVLEYDMCNVEYVKNLLIQCNQVNKALLDGKVEDPVIARNLLDDNMHRISSCILHLSNLHESMSEYEVSND